MLLQQQNRPSALQPFIHYLTWPFSSPGGLRGNVSMSTLFTKISTWSKVCTCSSHSQHWITLWQEAVKQEQETLESLSETSFPPVCLHSFWPLTLILCFIFLTFRRPLPWQRQRRLPLETRLPLEWGWSQRQREHVVGQSLKHLWSWHVEDKQRSEVKYYFYII